MTKSELLDFQNEGLCRYDSLAKVELNNISKSLHELANDIDSSNMLNEYKLEKILKKVEEYKKWKNMAGISQSIISNIKMLDKLD